MHTKRLTITYVALAAALLELFALNLFWGSVAISPRGVSHSNAASRLYTETSGKRSRRCPHTTAMRASDSNSVKACAIKFFASMQSPSTN